MRIGFYQFSPVFGDVKANVSKMVRIVRASDADILVMPELATSGYFFGDKEELLEVSEPIAGESVGRLIDASRESNTHVVLGIPELVEKPDARERLVYNSAVLLGPNGVVGVYRKVHLFNTEKRLFAPGDRGFPTFEVNGVRVGLLVCFDHMFPEAARTLALEGAQIICHPSNLVLPELGQLTTRVRAIENKVFWILGNRYGRETKGEKTLLYTGRSQVVAPDGKVLVSALESEDLMGVVDIDPELAKNKQIAELNDVFKDRKPQYYRLG